MQKPKVRGRGFSTRSSHIKLPMQIILGLVFMASGTLLLLKKFGNDLVPFISEEVLVIICGAGSALGGFYLLLTRIWRPRIYL